MDITEDVVKLVAQKISRRLLPNGMDSEALQGWLLKFGENSKKLLISLEMFVDWISNNNSL